MTGKNKMPRYPKKHPRVEPLRASVFATLAQKMRRYRGQIHPLHIGDTYRHPPEAASRIWNSAVKPEDLNTYGHPHGLDELLDLLILRLHQKPGFQEVDSRSVQITCGATHALFCSAQALVGPGDEVLVLAPFWPLIQGIILCTGATPVHVPFYSALLDDPEQDPTSLIRPYLTDRTAALYLNTPNNPTGMVLGRENLEALARLCLDRGLWVLSDEAYEDYIYEGEKHLSMASLNEISSQVVSVYTFSKSHALSGMRVGYFVANDRLLSTVQKIANHSVYNVPVLAQRVAAAALVDGRDWMEETRLRYRKALDLVTSRLKCPFHRPRGGSYIFFDTSLMAPDVWTFIDRALEAGVSLAPGEAFGSGFSSFVRLCFTAVDLPQLKDAIERLNSVLC